MILQGRVMPAVVSRPVMLAVPAPAISRPSGRLLWRCPGLHPGLSGRLVSRGSSRLGLDDVVRMLGGSRHAWVEDLPGVPTRARRPVSVREAGIGRAMPARAGADGR
jgi:hypothetical protein